MPRIDSLRLRLFRGFHDISLENLGRINVILGSNNSGKSSVLEALYLLCRPMAFDRWRLLPKLRRDSQWSVQRYEPSRSMANDEEIGWFFPERSDSSANELLIEIKSLDFPFRDLCVLRETLEMSSVVKEEDRVRVERARRVVRIRERHDLRSFVKNRDNQDEIELNFVNTDKMREIPEYKPSDAPRYPRHVWAGKKDFMNYRVSVSHCKTGKKLVRNIIPFGANEEACFEEEKHYFSDLDCPHVFVQPQAIWSEDELNPINLIPHIEVTNGRDQIIELFRGFDPDITDYTMKSTVSGRRRIYLKHNNFVKRVPLDCFGNGLKRAFVLIASAAAARDGILLVDEVETGLHYSAMQRTMKALILAAQAFNVQIFLTTHSLEAIDAFLDAARENASLDEVVGFSLNQNKTKQPKRLDGQMMQRLRFERGFEVR